MAQFLNSACIKTSTPKIVETKYGYIFNGTYYNKKSFIPESLADSVMNGNASCISLSHTASMPIYNSGSYAGPLVTSDRGNRLIKDTFEEDIYYIFTEDMNGETRNAEAYCYKIKETETYFEIIEKNRYTSSAGTYWYMSFDQFLGQSDTDLFVSLSSSYANHPYYYPRTYILMIDKKTLVGTFINYSTVNSQTYNKMLETPDFIYLYTRLANTASQVWVIDKKVKSFTLFKDALPAFTTEIAGQTTYTVETIMTSESEGYIVDIDNKLINDSTNFVHFNLGHFHKLALTANGQPQVVDLRKEVAYTLNNYSISTQHVPCPLFRKNNFSATYNNAEVAYWSGETHYVDITFNEEVNLWRAGTSNYQTYNNKFIIKKFDDVDQTFKDISATVTQTLTAINHVQWEKTISNLPAGRYRFEFGGLRMDGGWYLEKATGEEYYGDLVYGINDPTDITVITNSITLKDPETMTLPGAINYASWHVSNYLFSTTVNNVTYLHKLLLCNSSTDWATDHSAKATLRTYRIDEVEKSLVYIGECPLSNMPNPIKAFALNHEKNKIVGLSNGNTFIHRFDEIEEKFVPVKYFAIISKAIGFDEENNIWILNDKSELLKYNETIPERLDIIFKDSNLEYAGDEIKTSISLIAKNYLDQQLVSSWTLKASGNAKFENGTNTIDVITTAAAALDVPLTITGSGVILIYPVLKLDIKNKGEI